MTVRADLEALCAQPIADLGAGRTAERWLTMFDWALGGSVRSGRSGVPASAALRRRSRGTRTFDASGLPTPTPTPSCRTTG